MAGETVIYEISGTFYEVPISCSGSELIYGKMKWLIKSENLKTPTDKKRKSNIIKVATCLSGVHYRRNEGPTENTHK